jgi:hypothetical protein
VITLSELQARRQKLTAAWPQIEQERQPLAHTRQPRVHGPRVIENAVTFRQLLGDHLDPLSCEERQAVTQCLINKVIVTGADVDGHFLLPFECTPQVSQRLLPEPEGSPGHVYRLRLAHFQVPFTAWSGASTAQGIRIHLSELPALLGHSFIGQHNPTFGHQFFDIPVAQAKTEVQPEPNGMKLGKTHERFHRVSCGIL